MLNEKALKIYLKKKFRNVSQIKINKLGSGVHGSGFLIDIKTKKGLRSYVVKTLMPENFGHEYPSDRAGIFLLDFDEFKNLPKHVKAVDVLAEMGNGSIKSIGGGKEYYLLMEKAEGKNYFNDLNGFVDKDNLGDSDIQKIKAMALYLANIHSVKKISKTLYWRKLRDTVGHGECLMGVFDTYPNGTLPYGEMTDIIKKSVDWIYRLKPKYKRLSQIHGDFHPGNIWFKENAECGMRNADNAPSYPPLFSSANPPECGKPLRSSPCQGEEKGEVGGRGSYEIRNMKSKIDFVVLDRSRGPWGEPADDVAALAINYIFYSIKYHAAVRGAYLEGLKIFFEEYVRLSRDMDIYYVLAPFFAFRGVVIANPVFYPDVTPHQRRVILNFVHNILNSEKFEFTFSA